MKIEILQHLSDLRARKVPCAVVTEIASGRQVLVADTIIGDLSISPAVLEKVRSRIAADQSGVMDEGFFVRVYTPPARMIIVGAVHIAQALAPMAQVAGFDVTVIDPREAFVRSGNLAHITSIVAWPDEAMADVKPDMRTAVVTLTHDPKLDDPALDSALKSPAFYIGALGSRKTHAKRVDRLKAAGFTDADIARIHGPVGIDINALSPAEIAVSILAQVVQVLRAEAT